MQLISICHNRTNLIKLTCQQNVLLAYKHISNSNKYSIYQLIVKSVDAPFNIFVQLHTLYFMKHASYLIGIK